MAFQSWFSLRRVSPWLIVLAFLVLFFSGACGGGGGTGGSNGSTGTVGYPTNIAADAFFHGTQAPASGLGTNSSPYTLVPGDVVDIQLWGVNVPTGQPEQVTASGFSFQPPAPSSSIATLTTAGVLTAVAPSSGTFVVNVTYAGGSGYSGGTASFVFQIVPAGAKVAGFVRDPTQAAVAGVVITFYGPGGSAILQTMSGFNGAFTANLPTSAVSFTADGSSLVGCSATNPSAPCYFKEYGYGSFYYSTISTNCYTPLPALVAGHTMNLPNQIIMLPANNSGSPPPPPTGCQG